LSKICVFWKTCERTNRVLEQVYCISLQNAAFPEAVHIGDYAFADCTKLAGLEIPKANRIGEGVFADTENSALTITLGSAAPAVGEVMFRWVNVPKYVTVKVPAGAAGYGAVPSAYSGSSAVQNWGNAFRGIGWDGSVYDPNDYGATVNSNITLEIQER
jgi:hypothetical protein